MSTSNGEIPKQINRYEIERAIGYGAMGAVYKAFDPLIKRPVALKTIRVDVPPGSPDYKAFLERFATEARTAGRLSHPNIVTLYDVAPPGDPIPWLAMEYIEGQTVADLLEKETPAPEVVVGLVSQIASAIDYAHSEGVIHRDIKPSNVIVFGGEKVKVTDFGIAKLMDAEVTQSGLTMGTPSYMSPEQAMGDQVDARTDIFSLGVVAFEMLSGHQPFPGNNVTSILYKLVHTDPVHPDNLEVLGLLPDKWREVFSTVLAKNPDERFRTAADFVKQLEQCLGSWFGALEGETVVVKAPVPLLESSEDAVTVVDSAPPAEPSAVDAGGEEMDETFIEPPPPPPPPEATPPMSMPSAPPVDPAFDSSTEELSRDEVFARAGSVGLDGETLEMGADPEGETVQLSTSALGDVGGVDANTATIVPDREDGEDETLVVGPPDAAAATPLPPAPPPKKAIPATYLLAGGAVLLVAVATVAWMAFSSRPSAGDRIGPELSAPDETPPVLIIASGTLSIVTEPEGATVFVDGEPRGESPVLLEDLPLATYDIRVERQGYQAQEMSAELTEQAPEQSLDIGLEAVPQAPKPAFLRVSSEPPGAQVEIDGRTVGQTPSEALRVPAGGRTVRLVLDGYLPWEDSVRARSGRTVDVDAVLTARPGAVEEPDPEPQPEPEVAAPRVRVGELVRRGDRGVVNPECVSCPPVPYPEAAKRNRLQGVVELDFLIDETGNVDDILVRGSAGEIFDNIVVSTVSRWRYKPATKEGVPVKMRWTQRFRFRQGR